MISLLNLMLGLLLRCITNSFLALTGVEHNRVCFTCHNVVIGIFEPPTESCFERVWLEEKCGRRLNMAVMN